MRLIENRFHSLINITHLSYLLFLFISIINHCNCVIHPDGRSTVSGYQDDLGNYQFDYTIASNDGEHFHKAATDPLGRVVGSYGLTLSDGRHRFVDYVADKNGFRAHIRSNEPGIISAHSADASIEKIDSPISTAFLPGIHQRLKLEASDPDINSDEDISKNELKLTASKVTYVRPEENEEHRREHVELSIEDDDELGKSVTYHEPLTADEIPLERAKEFDDDSGRKLDVFNTNSESLPEIEITELNSKENRKEKDEVLLSRDYNPPIDPKSIAIPPNQFQRRRYPSSNTYPHDESSSYTESSSEFQNRLNFRSPLPSNSDFEEYLREYHTHSSPKFPNFNYQNNGNYFTIPSLFSDGEKPLHPSLTMSTVHGGHTGQNSYNSHEYGNPYGIRINEYPRNYHPTVSPNYHSTYELTKFPLQFGARLPTQPTRKPNLVLRTVAIPNGIQAVPVNPATGEVHRNNNFGTHDSRYNFNNNNNYNYDQDLNQRNHRTFSQFPNLRNQFPLLPATGHTPSHLPNAFGSPRVSQQHPNVRNPSEASLSKPSFKDLAVISRVTQHVNNRQHSGISPNSHYPRQHDPPPDYPNGSSNLKLSHQVADDHKIDNEPKKHYPTLNAPTPIRRPSVAVRLPGFDEPQNTRFGNREYRSTSQSPNNRDNNDKVNSNNNKNITP